ncbi:MAG: VWA domain-containing protein [Spirochaetaceae bacterium]|jgi:Ca-activated chloride channel family protein|nr:VWA domain-containing protein [Spirochaetaceae bacterium]
MEYRRGVDVMFAFDVSRSMDVQDSTPAGEKSRLKHAADIARAMIAASQGIRFGAAIGKGQSLLAVPLTYDVETIRVFLESLSTSIIAGKGGTNLERLLDAASQGFQNTLPTKRCMLVFSDGESWSGSLSAALDRLDAAEITVVAVGMGTEAGGPVPQESGEPPPISYRREAALRNIAERTGGLYVDPNREDAPKVLEQYFIALSHQTGIKGYKIEEQARWRIFMLIGLASFGLAKILEKRMRGRG